MKKSILTTLIVLSINYKGTCYSINSVEHNHLAPSKNKLTLYSIVKNIPSKGKKIKKELEKILKDLIQMQRIQKIISEKEIYNQLMTQAAQLSEQQTRVVVEAFYEIFKNENIETTMKKLQDNMSFLDTENQPQTKPDIHILNINPVLDVKIDINKYPSEKNITIAASGKGANSRRFLNNSGIRAQTYGFLGGKTGKLIQALLMKEGIVDDTYLFKKDQETRLGIYFEGQATEVRLIDKGLKVTMKDGEELIEKIISSVKQGDYFLISGSLIKGLKQSYYAKLITKLKEKKVRTILDTSKQALTEGIKSKPFILKINAKEFSYIVKNQLSDQTINLNNLKQTQDLINKLNLGINHIVISRGKKATLYFAKDKKTNKVWSITPPLINEVDSVGAGDSMSATMLYLLSQGESILNSIKVGIAAGTSTTLQPGGVYGNLEEAKSLLKDIVISS